MTQDKKTIQEWIDKINNFGRDLTKWEEDFMESITDWFKIHQHITNKQEEILERIYAEKTPN